jgi:mannose-6-phosphate isomerase-like protein (cupin superfamily)
VPVSGKLEITIGSSKPAGAASGQAFFIEKGAPHGFPNVGDTPAAALEILVKDGASAAKIQALGVTPGALAKP